MPQQPVEELDPKHFIIIKGASVNNLKNIDVAIPRNKLVVVTGVSGSGKSSLAFDTLYAEGQRRYVESLSSYARQFMGKMDKPEVEYIKGIAPAIAIEQKVNTRNPRSTVGTSTEIYDYLKLLFARIGKTYSPISNELVKKDDVEDVINHIATIKNETVVFLLAPVTLSAKQDMPTMFRLLLQKGFTRIVLDGEIAKIEDVASRSIPKGRASKKKSGPDFYILVDRIVVDNQSEEMTARISDSANTSFYEGHGSCIVATLHEGLLRDFKEFNNRFERDGMTFEIPNTNLFAFNNPYGACKRCEGFGSIIGIDPDLVIPDKSLSVYEGAIACWNGEKMTAWKDLLIKNSYKFDFPIHKPIYDLTKAQYQVLWKGNKYFHGLDTFFAELEKQIYKIQYRVMLARYRGKTSCPECAGTRLRADANYVKIKDMSISELVLMPVDKSLAFFKSIKLSKHDAEVGKRILVEITNRLQYLSDVGLGYLTLNRLSNTLSGGESQRINLATSLGSSLVGSMYILDEPSIGLHPRDTERLIGVLQSLKKLGNTLIVVEHDEAIMRNSDQLIDIGPHAGTDGGHLVFQGTFDELVDERDSLTAQYLTNRLEIPLPAKRRKWAHAFEIIGARENNLKNLRVKFPLNVMTVITGVSGSGKTTLIKKIVVPALMKMHGGYSEATGNFDKLDGAYHQIKGVEMIDQNPIGKSSRSNPVTYMKAYDEIRALYADLPMSQMRKLKPAHFSFNVEGGRCDTCEGEGMVTIEMQFMADIHLKCEACHGKRFKDEVLAVKYRERSIDEILEMTINEALDFFNYTQTLEKFNSYEKKIAQRIQPLKDVGLGYIKLGQASSSLSGGEAQRIKLASFLVKGTGATDTLFIFDEPTTGLHFHDIRKLLDAFNALIRQGNSLLIIEHNTEVIKCADWIIDLGPEGGDEGGHLVFEGTPEDLVKEKKSYTGKYLKEKLTAKL